MTYSNILYNRLKILPPNATEDSTTERRVAIVEKFVKYINNSFSFTLEHTL
jgi:hypothetical protein